DRATTAGDGQTLDQFGGRLAHFFGKLREQALLLVDQVTADRLHETSPGDRRRQHHRPPIAGMGGTRDVALALEGGHDTAGRTLVEAQLGREVVQRDELPAQERVEGVALRGRDVVAADAVAVAELVDADEFRKRVLQLPRLPCERRVAGFHSWYRQLYSAQELDVKRLNDPVS